MIPKITRRQLLKSLSMDVGGGAEATLQVSVAQDIIPLIRQNCFVRQIADKTKSMINMTRPVFRIPKLMRAQGVYGVKAGQPAPSFTARIDSIELKPEKLLSFLAVDSEVFEDSTITSIEGMLRAEMANEFAQGEEIGFLLGNKDFDHGNGDVRNLFDGLFKSAAATPQTYDTSLDTNSPVVANIIRAMRRLGIYGRNKRDVTILVGLSAEEALLRNTQFQTMSAYAFAGQAGIFTGELGRLAGATVVATSFLDAQPGETYSRCLVMANSAFMIGDWQAFDVRLYDELYAQTDQVAIRCRERVAMAVRYPEAMTQILNFPANP